ncbi:unnamed protein product [Paramecium primaurelia]|uniref:Transmembrane protein n=1 Tax=Paramecium primaurelia TaxID=5886 RepID=A0A8S1LT16_PARPR|nr:unnamed protein product [Paramecium primaurelia]
MQIYTTNGTQHLRDHIDNKKHLSSSSHGGGSPIAAIFFGGLFIVGAFCMLWYNERRQAITEYRINQAYKECTSVNSAEINPNTNNKLIHTNGQSHTNSLIIDDIFGLKLSDCVKLIRTVEMFQWVRRSRQENNRTTYYYEQIWSSTFHAEVGDGYFNDQSKWIVQAQDQINENVYVGAYLLTKSLAEQTDANEIINLTTEHAQNVAKYFQNQRIFQHFDAQGKEMYFQQEKGRIINNDLRVSFRAARIGPTTVVSQQQNNTFTPFIIHDKYEQTLNQDGENIENSNPFGILSCCCCCCLCCCQLCKAIEQPLSELNLLYQVILTQQQVFKKLAEEYACLTLCQRITGYILMGFGFYLIFYPVTWVVSIIPLIGEFLAAITGFAFFLVSFLISIPFSILTIALAWLFYHPKYGIALIALSGLIGTAIYFYLKSQQ